MNFRRALGLIGAAGLGAAVMYLADPRMGRRRRSLVRDQFVSTNKKVRHFIVGRAEDMKHRAYGKYCEVRSRVGIPCEPTGRGHA